MNKVLITGGSGFVGTNLIIYLKNLYFCIVTLSLRSCFDEKILKKASSIIHLAGKAHDLKKVSSPDEYYQVNTELTKKIFDTFLKSDAKVFITLSSVKAVADEFDGELTEDVTPSPITHYGKSKLLAEQYILSQP